MSTIRLYALIALGIPLLALAGCAGFQGRFTQPIRTAHGAAMWDRKEVVAFDFDLAFGENSVLDSTIFMTPDMSRVRIRDRDGTDIWWDGSQAWLTPEDADFPGARFHLLTWPYFLAAPFKLRDPGTHLEPMGMLPMDGSERPAAKLTFSPGVGDSPGDWYIVYRDPGSGRMDTMAYIVTYDKSVEEAEQEPHAIRYEDYREIGGVLIPHRWTIYNWSLEEGIYGEPLIDARLSGVRFPRLGEVSFEAPEGAQELPKP